LPACSQIRWPFPRLNLRQLAGHFPHREPKPKRPDLPAKPDRTQSAQGAGGTATALANTKYVVPGKRGSHIPIVPPPPTRRRPIVPTTRPLSVGFFINWDESSYESLKRNLDHLDWVVPNGRTCKTRRRRNPLATDIHIPALNWIRVTRPKTRILPMVQKLIEREVAKRSAGALDWRRATPPSCSSAR
jgi:hypothetical protein